MRRGLPAGALGGYLPVFLKLSVMVGGILIAVIGVLPVRAFWSLPFYGCGRWFLWPPVTGRVAPRFMGRPPSPLVIKNYFQLIFS